MLRVWVFIRDIAMYRFISAMCSFIVGSGLVLGCANAAEKDLQGTWTATKAERDGRPAADVVGHRLSVSGNRFQIQSKDMNALYSGTIRVDTSVKPAAIDFEQAEGGLKGMTWKGIYALDGNSLTICDNAENLDAERPSTFDAKSGSGYILVTFDRAP
jgi:uncharacterized protein (TIGR03067 family)